MSGQIPEDKRQLTVQGRSIPKFALQETKQFFTSQIRKPLILTLANIIMGTFIGILLGVSGTAWGIGLLVGLSVFVISSLISLAAIYLWHLVIEAPRSILREHQKAIDYLTPIAFLPDIDITVNEALIELRNHNDVDSVNCFLDVTLHNKSVIESNLRSWSLALMVNSRKCEHVIALPTVKYFYLSIVVLDFIPVSAVDFEEREVAHRKLEDLSEKISEQHVLIKGHSKSGWLGFTAHDLNLPVNSVVEWVSEQDDEGEYKTYQTEVDRIPDLSAITELILTVVDGYGTAKTVNVKGPFTKYGKRIKPLIESE